MKVLFVCLGNICRSPLAQGLLEKEVAARGLDWSVDSAGTAGYHSGSPPDPRSVAVAAKYGLDISRQRSRKVTAADLDSYDLILGLDRQNVANLLELAGRGQNNAVAESRRRKIHPLLVYVGLAETEGADVFDPYYDDDAYEPVYQQLKRAVAELIGRLTNQG